MSEKPSFAEASAGKEKKWWERVPVLSHIVNAIMWMFGRK